MLQSRIPHECDGKHRKKHSLGRDGCRGPGEWQAEGRSVNSKFNVGPELNLAIKIKTGDAAALRIVPTYLSPPCIEHAAVSGKWACCLAKCRMVEGVEQLSLELESPAFREGNLLGDRNVVKEPVRSVEINRGGDRPWRGVGRNEGGVRATLCTGEIFRID